jgi:hypothetical protein
MRSLIMNVDPDATDRWDHRDVRKKPQMTELASVLLPARAQVSHHQYEVQYQKMLFKYFDLSHFESGGQTT